MDDFKPGNPDRPVPAGLEFLPRLLALCGEGKPPAALLAGLCATPVFADKPEPAPQIAGLVRESQDKRAGA